MVSCQNNTTSKKIVAVSSEQLAAEINKNLPPQTVEKVHPGKAVFDANCLTCHQADGSGVPGMHPPLVPGSWVSKEPRELVAIMMKGLSGKIEVNGEVYNDFMPSQAQLSDQEIADVLSYVRSNFGNNLGPVTVDLVNKIRSGR
jgi:mono/diheme cytochrome c family protein